MDELIQITTTTFLIIVAPLLGFCCRVLVIYSQQNLSGVPEAFSQQLAVWHVGLEFIWAVWKVNTFMSAIQIC